MRGRRNSRGEGWVEAHVLRRSSRNGPVLVLSGAGRSRTSRERGGPRGDEGRTGDKDEGEGRGARAKTAEGLKEQDRDEERGGGGG